MTLNGSLGNRLCHQADENGDGHGHEPRRNESVEAQGVAPYIARKINDHFFSKSLSHIPIDFTSFQLLLILYSLFNSPFWPRIVREYVRKYGSCAPSFCPQRPERRVTLCTALSRRARYSFFFHFSEPESAICCKTPT